MSARKFREGQRVLISTTHPNGEEQELDEGVVEVITNLRLRDANVPATRIHFSEIEGCIHFFFLEGVWRQGVLKGSGWEYAQNGYRIKPAQEPVSSVA